MILGDIRFVPFPNLANFILAYCSMDQSSSNPSSTVTSLITDILKLGTTPVKTEGEAWMDVSDEGVTEAIPTLPTVPVGNRLDPMGMG